METTDAILKRRSIREFSEKIIANDDLIKLIEAARLAPTARNEQPWEFIVITEVNKRRELSKITGNNGAFISNAQAVIVVFCLNTKYYLEDGCAATENILVSATDLNIGSCWIAGDKKPYCEEIKKLLNVPAEYNLVSIIALGYPMAEPKIIPKRSSKEILHWQSF